MRKFILLVFLYFIQSAIASDSNLQKFNIYQRITSEFESTYNDLAKKEAQRVLKNKDTFLETGLNKIGFSFNKNFGDFNLSLERYIEPSLKNDTDYLSRNIFEISISAEKLYGKLNKLGYSQLTKKELAAYAGISFKRKISFVRVCTSYKDALFFDFSTLFFPFNYSKVNFLKKMGDGEFFKIEDSLQLKAGAFATLPISSSSALKAGILYSSERLGKVEVESVGGSILISSSKQKSRKLKISIQLITNFFHLLRISVLQYDFSYSYGHQFKYNYQIPKENLFDESLKEPLSKLLKQRPFNDSFLKRYSLMIEDVEYWTKKRNLKFLMWGRDQSIEVSRRKIVMDDKEKIFYTHHFLDSKYVQPSKYLIKSYQNNKEMSISYSSNKDLINNDLYIHSNPNDDKFNISIKFYRNIFMKNLHQSKRKIKKIMNYLENETSFSPLLKEKINSGFINNKISSNSELNVGVLGINYFLDLSSYQIYKQIVNVCKSSKNSCFTKLSKRYYSLLESFSPNKISRFMFVNCMQIVDDNKRKSSIFQSCLLLSKSPTRKKGSQQFKIRKLSEFIRNFYKYSNSKKNLLNLFGKRNVFIKGVFNADKFGKYPVCTFFKEGDYHRDGVMDRYLNNDITN